MGLTFNEAGNYFPYRIFSLKIQNSFSNIFFENSNLFTQNLIDFEIKITGLLQRMTEEIFQTVNSNNDPNLEYQVKLCHFNNVH